MKAVPPAFHKSLDGGWGWLVVFAAFIVHCISLGIQNSFGVLLPSLLDDFNESRSKTAWIGSVLYGTPLLFGPVASFVTYRIGYRKATVIGGFIACVGFSLAAFMHSVEAMILTYGIIAGIGLSLAYLSSVVMVASYFERKRVLAIAVAKTGAGVGTFAMATLIKYLVDVYGWRGAVLVISGISFNIVACGALYRPIQGHSITSIQNRSDNLGFEKDSSKSDAKITEQDRDEYKKDLKNPFNTIKYLIDFSIFQNKAFLLFTFSEVMYAFCSKVPYAFVVDRARQFHMDRDMVGFVVPSMGITNIVGKVLCAFIGDRKQINRNYFFGVNLLVSGVLLCIIPLFTEIAPNLVICCLYGLFSASEPVLCAVIVVDILGIDKLDNAFGLLMFLKGIAISVGPPVAGWLYETSGSYDNTFYSAGTCIAISGALMISAALWKTKLCRIITSALFRTKIRVYQCST